MLDVTTVNGLHTADGREHAFDVLYPMMEEVAHSSLAAGLSVRVGDCGDLVVDGHQCTTVDGLYAVGDVVVVGINQISMSAGQAAVAATDVHNQLPPCPRQAAVTRS